MGRIDLGREKGATPSPSAQFGGTSAAGYEYAMRGMDRLSAAQNDLSRGIRHVGDALFRVYEDLAETRNRQEFLEGQTKQFDITTEENKALEQRMESGEFDGKDGIKRFEDAVNAAQGKIDSELGKWADKNITSPDTRKMLLGHSKLAAKRNFAHLSGRFLAHDQRRRWDMCQSQLSNAVMRGEYENGIMAIDAWGVGKSPELVKQMKQKYTNDYCAQRLEDVKGQIALMTEPDAVAAKLAEIQGSAAYAAVYEKDRLAFDIFACNRIDTLDAAQAREQAAQAKAEETAAKKAAKQAAEDAEKYVSAAVRACVKEGDVLYKGLDVPKMRKDLRGTLEKTGISDAKIAGYLERFDSHVLDAKANIRKQVEGAMKQQAVDTLAEADKNGFFDIEAISGKDASFANKLREARGEMLKAREVYNLLKNKINEGEASPEDEKRWEDYRKSYFQTLNGILKYDDATDRRGEKLAKLCVEIDKFDDIARKELLHALNGKVNGGVNAQQGKAPSNWRTGELSQFDEQIATLCEWEDNTKWWWQKSDSDPVAFMKLRNRLLEYASIRQLTYAETLKEMQNDPFLKSVYLKKAMDMGMKALDL